MKENDDSLLRQVDEELRRERFEKLWKAYGTYIIAAAACLLVGVGAFQYWQGRVTARSEAAGADYRRAQQLVISGKAEEANKALAELSKSAPSGVVLLARLQQAALSMKAGKSAEALTTFETIAKDGSADVMLRDFARLQAAAIRLADADFTEMKNRLTDLTGDKSYWRANAQELLGMAALKAGKMDLARGEFQKVLSDRNAPPGVAENVRIAMATIVAAELAQQSQAAPPAAGGAGQPAGK